MRIIAGEFRGRKLLPPSGQQTRPITDRVKQSLFDILAPTIEGSRVYDCFAGTGSMGIECLSRGALHATFFERDRSALELLRQNIDSIGMKKQSTIVAADIFRWFHTPPAEPSHADIVFLDPPYRFLIEEPHKLRQLARDMSVHLTASSVVMFRHDANDRLELPNLARYDQREYGGMMLEFLRKSDG
jgi:16S rRNA (guanine966-N2)-methyltransferase